VGGVSGSTLVRDPVNGLAIHIFRADSGEWTLWRLVKDSTDRAYGGLRFFKLQMNPPMAQRKVGMWRTYWFAAGANRIRPSSQITAFETQRPILAAHVLPWTVEYMQRLG